MTRAERENKAKHGEGQEQAKPNKGSKPNVWAHTLGQPGARPSSY